MKISINITISVLSLLLFAVLTNGRSFKYYDFPDDYSVYNNKEYFDHYYYPQYIGYNNEEILRDTLDPNLSAKDILNRIKARTKSQVRKSPKIMTKNIYLLIITVLYTFTSTTDTIGYDYYVDYPEEYLEPMNGRHHFRPHYYTKIKSPHKRYPHKRNHMSNKQILSDLMNPELSVDQVSARLPKHERIHTRDADSTLIPGTCQDDNCRSCLDSCEYLKQSQAAKDDITQYTYLRMCSEGCKQSLNCLFENSCLPVMQENPDFFIICANKCNLFQVIPAIFKTTDC